MVQTKYGNLLTIILIVIIVLILVIGGILISKWYKGEKIKKENEKVISQISDNNITDTNTLEPGETKQEENVVVPEITDVSGGTTKTSTKTGGTKKKVYLNNFVVSGYIEIPKTGIKYAIIETSSVKALETAVAIAYPSNPVLNTPGNVVIQGHNYRNGKFFSNNKKLKIGDKIKITDTSNKTLTYTIYEIFETTPEDAAYFTRDTGDNIEISLSTCTDDGKARLVILAKV